MNHLGDANKMVETPRTQAVWELFATGTTLPHDVEFSTLARQLERELNAANQIAKKYEDRYFAALARIKRLEEAGDALLELCEADESKFHLADHIDARCDAWRKAKEAKP